MKKLVNFGCSIICAGIIATFGVSDVALGQVDLLGQDPGYESQWGLRMVHANEIWAISTGQGVKVGVIDSGSGPNPDLIISHQHSIIRGRHGDDGSDADKLGHGTHVSGIIAAQTNNDIGISGVAPHASIIAIRILDSSGNGTESDLALAIYYAVEMGARVINLSLGGKAETQQLINALQFAADHNVLVVSAAGNGGPDGGTTYPAGNELTLAVTAVDQTMNSPSFAQRGPYIDISAPGVSVCSTVRLDAILDVARRCAGQTDPYITMSGTSMAAAFVSGVAALMISVRPSLTALQVREILLATATDIGEPGRDNQFGVGLINAYAVFKALGYFADAVIYPSVSSLGQVGTINIGVTTQLPLIEHMQWHRCKTPGEATIINPDDCKAIPQTQQTTYLPTQKDIGSFLRFSALVTAGGTSQHLFSATTPRIFGIWVSMPSVEVGLSIPVKQLVQSSSKGSKTLKVISGPCKVQAQKTLVALATGKCKIQISTASKGSYPKMTRTSTIEVIDKLKP